MAWCMGASKSNLSNAILSKPVGSVGGGKKKACNAVANLGTKSAQHPREVRFLRYLHSKPLSQKRRQSGWYKQNLNKDSEFEAFFIGSFGNKHSAAAPSQLDPNSPKELRKS